MGEGKCFVLAPQLAMSDWIESTLAVAGEDGSSSSSVDNSIGPGSERLKLKRSMVFVGTDHRNRLLLNYVCVGVVVGGGDGGDGDLNGDGDSRRRAGSNGSM
ncbi:hypothetical protein PoB_002634000 [Plakobranchus ocellatus]|uniref:Uncharacterized protein n=1 Tax=Plakobranchus ocellatus TaxID=259542 RepID=A0AAV3ZYV2_9GAST|nr:hypothetical protein PoB_002634000 [Plakobranchus ocellatus]